MTTEEEKTLKTLETRIRQLILKFQQTKEEVEELQEEVVVKDREFLELKRQNQLLEANYANLKMAKMLEIGDTDLSSAKQRLNRLVRDVDKCIALLKAMGPDATTTL